LKPRQLSVSPDEDPPHAGEECWKRGGGCGKWLHLVGSDRRRQTLELETPKVGKAGVRSASGDSPYDCGGEDLSTASSRHEAGRLDHGHAEDIALFEDDVAEGEADADGDWFAGAGMAIDGLLQGDGTAECVSR
jgi:hypothetical protein